jgi:IS30 family transposase
VAKLGRQGMSDELRAQLWSMWGSGKSFSEISRAIGHPPGSIFTVIKQTGGYAPRPRKRRPGALNLAEREEISRGLARGDSLRRIARALGRAPSTVSREVARNRGRRKYRAIDADDRAWRRARRPKVCLLARDPVLRGYVAARLADDWSPEQVAGVLARDAPIGTGVRVSHETIYKSLFVQSRGVLAKQLQQHLRSGRPTRRNIHNTVTGQWRSQIKDAVSIRERPAEAADRAIPGHWEGDLLLGRHWTQIATVVERSTRFTVLVALDGRDMTTVTAGLSREMTRLPERLRKSLTWDRGMELADHKTVTITTGLDVYFADPRSPWQRGTNENTNRLLRQYLPKGQSMAHLTQHDLDAIAAKLNSRPRKTLNFDTPADRLAAELLR